MAWTAQLLDEDVEFSNTPDLVFCYRNIHLAIIQQNRAEYRLILSRQGRSRAELVKIRGYSATFNRIIVLLFNTNKEQFCCREKNSSITDNLETGERIVILPFFSPTLETTYIAGYLLTSDQCTMTILG